MNKRISDKHLETIEGILALISLLLLLVAAEYLPNPLRTYYHTFVGYLIGLLSGLANAFKELFSNPLGGLYKILFHSFLFNPIFWIISILIVIQLFKQYLKGHFSFDSKTKKDIFYWGIIYLILSWLIQVFWEIVLNPFAWVIASLIVGFLYVLKRAEDAFGYMYEIKHQLSEIRKSQKEKEN